MWILRLAWKNLWRNRHRTLITVSAVFFAVILSAVAESLKRGVFDNLVKNVVSFYTGYIQVHKKGYQDEQILDNSFRLSPQAENKIRSIRDIKGLTPRLESFALASSEERTRGCMISGIIPKSENDITALQEKVVKGSYIDADDRSVLLAQGLAERLRLDVNDTIVLIGQGYHGTTAAGKYPVKGLVRFGSPQLNERILFMPLREAQAFFSADEMATSYILSVHDNKRLSQTGAHVLGSVGNDYEVMTWEELLPEIKQHIETDSNNMKVVQGVLYLLICFGIFSTLVMLMLERKFEMGMLLAIGMKKTKMVLLMIAESVLTVSIGCVLGIITSIPLIFYLNRYPIRIGGETGRTYERFGFEAIFPTSTEPSIFIYQAMVVLVIGLLMSLYPVIKILRMDPVSAMRT